MSNTCQHRVQPILFYVEYCFPSLLYKLNTISVNLLEMNVRMYEIKQHFTAYLLATYYHIYVLMLLFSPVGVKLDSTT